MGRLDGKVALISGGARGQGAVEAKLFAREGARVIFGDVLDNAGKQVEDEIRQSGGEATYIHLDVTQESDWIEAVGTAVSTYGKLDILVNNAGILRREGIEETSKELWDTVQAVNATGVFLGTKHAIPAMRQAGGGSIVNISSVSGMVALGAPAYNASKGAVRVFTKVTAVHHATDNIRCNSIHPGPIDTPMTQDTDAARRQEIISKVPLGRYGTSEDIAYGVLYLASDEAAFMTGSELVIDGGYTAQQGVQVAYTPHHLTAKTLASRRALEGVRKQVTGLSSDVIDWSEFINGLDPEAAHMKGKVPWERIWAGGVIVCAL